MKRSKRTVSACVFLVVMGGSLSAIAQGRGVSPTPSPSSPGAIASVAAKALVLGDLTLTTTSYTGGPLGFDVAMSNPNAVAAPVKIAFGGPGTGLFAKDLTLPPSSTKHETFTDPNGLQAICSPKSYSAQLFNNGSVMPFKKARVTAACKFTTEVKNWWLTTSPDHVDAQQTGHLYIDGMKATGQKACGSTLHLTTDLVNHTKKTAKDVTVEVFDGPTKVGTSAAIDVAVGKSKPVALDLDVPVTGKLTVKLVDSKNSVAGAVTAPAVELTVIPACTLAIEPTP